MEAQKELDVLCKELDKAQFNDDESAPRLLKLKLIARNPADAPCVYRSEGLRTLARIAFDAQGEDKQHEKSSLEAARIIANALLLQDTTQQIFADLGYTNLLVGFYSQNSANHEFIGGRILFLLTYKSNVDFDDLIQHHELTKNIRNHLVNHVSTTSTAASSKDPMTVMALTETLKLVYNIASKLETRSQPFPELIPPLMQITNDLSIPPKPLDPPVSQLLNALGIIEWPSSLMSDVEDSTRLADFTKKLIEILDRSISSMSAAQAEETLIAPLTVLRKISVLGHEETKNLLRNALLPQDEERDKPIGQSQTLASKLLRLQSSAGVMVLPDAISGLLFDLSERDASKFVQNIGYGHAAGYLMSHQIPVPEDLTSEGQSRANGVKPEVNPITGQRLEAETNVPQPEMTDEEKEREAERLFVLFERMRATGVMNIENPLRSAQQSGRFEELSDSEPDT